MRHLRSRSWVGGQSIILPCQRGQKNALSHQSSPLPAATPTPQELSTRLHLPFGGDSRHGRIPNQHTPPDVDEAQDLEHSFFESPQIAVMFHATRGLVKNVFQMKGLFVEEFFGDEVLMRTAVFGTQSADENTMDVATYMASTRNRDLVREVHAYLSLFVIIFEIAITNICYENRYGDVFRNRVTISLIYRKRTEIVFTSSYQNISYFSLS